MFGWRSKQDNPADESQKLPVLSELPKQDIAVLFKHSPTCGTSWAAQAQVRKFIARHPEIPVYTLLVRRDRELSREIAAFTGVRHESPQVIVLRRGAVVANASHQDVTAEFLADHCVGGK